MSIYWYENDKELFANEVRMMQKFYPSFKLMKMPDGRLYWRGKVNPTGEGGGVWDLMVIYDNNHPLNIMREIEIIAEKVESISRKNENYL